MKSHLIYLLLITACFSLALNAQEKANNETLVTSEERQNNKLKSDIEKELEQEDLLEADHQKMHEDENMALKKANNKTQPEKDLKNSLQQLRSEKAKDKLINTHKNMEQAEAVLIRTEEKIAQAKEKIADPTYTKKFTPEELKEKEENLNKAIEVLERARENHQIYIAKIDEKVVEIQNKQQELLKNK